MKPDFDLVRAILLAVGDGENPGRGFTCPDVPGRSREEVSRHVEFLHEEGLIDAVNLSPSDNCRWVPGRLTPRGREFLESAKNEDSWRRAEKRLGRKSLSLSTLKQILFDFITEVFGL